MAYDSIRTVVENGADQRRFLVTKGFRWITLWAMHYPPGLWALDKGGIGRHATRRADWSRIGQ
jgi:hypothetical protein